jgi:spore germination protein GerM
MESGKRSDIPKVDLLTALKTQHDAAIASSAKVHHSSGSGVEGMLARISNDVTLEAAKRRNAW